jgi:release factor glutamine methyltransferase
LVKGWLNRKMILKNVLQKGIEILKISESKAPALEAGVILSYTVKRDKIYLYTHSEDEVSEAELERYLKLIGERAEGKPLQYITGQQEFMSLEFMVSEDVLIPRNDTETLVEAVITEAIKMNKPKIKILDIGTGSGCIAISLAHFIDNCVVTAVDISSKALEIAKVNAKRCKVNEKVTFIESSLFDCLKGNYDIIVSNPPYIETKQIQTLHGEVKDYEPQNALDGGEDGLYFYREIIRRAPEFLKPEGLLAFEIGYTQAKDVKVMMEKYFRDIVILKDLGNNDRVVMGLIIPSKFEQCQNAEGFLL